MPPKKRPADPILVLWPPERKSVAAKVWGYFEIGELRRQGSASSLQRSYPSHLLRPVQES